MYRSPKITVVYTFILSSSRYHPSLIGLAVHAEEECRATAEIMLSLQIVFSVSKLLPSIIIMYIYHALINALNAHTINVNLNTQFYTHVEHSPTETINIRYYIWKHTHTHTMTIAEIGY